VEKATGQELYYKDLFKIHKHLYWRIAAAVLEDICSCIKRQRLDKGRQRLLYLRSEAAVSEKRGWFTGRQRMQYLRG
jgi:hypothetical protein